MGLRGQRCLFVCFWFCLFEYARNDNMVICCRLMEQFQESGGGNMKQLGDHCWSYVLE